MDKNIFGGTKTILDDTSGYRIDGRFADEADGYGKKVTFTAIPYSLNTQGLTCTIGEHEIVFDVTGIDRGEESHGWSQGVQAIERVREMLLAMLRNPDSPMQRHIRR